MSVSVSVSIFAWPWRRGHDAIAAGHRYCQAGGEVVRIGYKAIAIDLHWRDLIAITLSRACVRIRSPANQKTDHCKKSDNSFPIAHDLSLQNDFC